MYHPLVAAAANIKDGDNPSYTAADFFKFYPQFTNLVPKVVIDSYLELAHSCVKEARYKGMWKLCIGLFLAHMLTLWLQSSKEAGTPADEVVAACQAAGVVTSESADGVSYSMDFGSVANDLQGWAQFKLTTFGVQFASTARLLGKGGMYVW